MNCLCRVVAEHPIPSLFIDDPSNRRNLDLKVMKYLDTNKKRFEELKAIQRDQDKRDEMIFYLSGAIFLIGAAMIMLYRTLKK